MIEWWNSLSVMMKVLWGITLSASLIFIIQSVMTFLGADAGDSDFDTDVSGDVPDGSDAPDGADAHGTGQGLLTFRNFVNFFLGFGWTAIILKSSIASTGLLMLVSILVGIALVVLVMLLFKWLSSMQQAGNINVFTSAVGCEGKVYLTIPAERSGSGKVQITINNSVREYEALTDGEALKTGTRIRVTEVIDADTLLVEPLESLII
ncbi:MAG: NfeD family protein [Bacteroidales bacterium]|nr:NfeD family protein [Bacteroidales bacterium]